MNSLPWQNATKHGVRVTRQRDAEEEEVEVEVGGAEVEEGMISSFSHDP